MEEDDKDMADTSDHGGGRQLWRDGAREAEDRFRSTLWVASAWRQSGTTHGFRTLSADERGKKGEKTSPDGGVQRDGDLAFDKVNC